MSRPDPFKKAEETLEDAGVIARDPSKREKLKLVTKISDLAESVGLILGRPPHRLFLRGTTVVKIEIDAASGLPDFCDISDAEFVTWVEQWIEFGKSKKDEDGDDVWIPMSIDQKKAKLILSSPQFRQHLPHVARKNRVRLPILRPPTEEHPKGKLELLPEGYDEQSGVFTFPSRVVIDESYTAEKAVSFYMNLYSEFPLPTVTEEPAAGVKYVRQDPRTLAACMGGNVAAFVEGILPPHTLRCGFIYTANSSGSGKSLLAKMAIAPVTGQAAGLTLARDEETLRGRIDAVLLSGQNQLFFDNVKGFIESQVIEALMTLPYWQGRTFHTQRVFTVRNETTIFMSGNDAKVSPDINRRFIYIDLYLDTPDPRDREISNEIDDAWLVNPTNRGEMLSALWAIVRHWDALGRPPAPSSIAGFRAWCDVVGGIVGCLGEMSGGRIGNPLELPKLSNAGDNQTSDLKKLVDLAVKSEHDDKQHLQFEGKELIEMAMSHGLFEWFLPELPEGKDPDTLLKQEHRIKFGRLIAAKSGEAPRGIVYQVLRDEVLERWRFSYRGDGRHRRYNLDRLEE